MAIVTFYGGGSFGTALAVSMAKNGHTCKIYDRNEKIIKDINNLRENTTYLKGIKIPDNITAYETAEEAIKESDFIFLAVPSIAVRQCAENINKIADKNQIIVNMAKGLEASTSKRLSQVLEEELPNNEVGIISGPSHAEEIAMDLPTTLVASSVNIKVAKKIQDVIMSKNLRLYTNDDLVGIEIGGAVKNVIALACGICDGMGYGDNTKAALMTRGMKEITEVGLSLGGKKSTFYGLTGMGDLIVTCTSLHSRNRRAGILIGKGRTIEKAQEEIGMVVEGIIACKAFYNLVKSKGIEMPITTSLYEVLFNSKNVKEVVMDLMARDKKHEIL